MSVSFRCDSCGKLLNSEEGRVEKMQCPHCKMLVLVPAGQALISQPGTTSKAPTQQVNEEDSELMVGVLSRLMPGVISILFHVGLFVILPLQQA